MTAPRSELGPEALITGLDAPAASPLTTDASAYVAASAAAVGLPIDPGHLPGVIESFCQLAIVADLVMSFAVADEIDPATVFRP
jgi:hypothetical protein